MDRAEAPDTIADGEGREQRDDNWAGATWEEALTLAKNGWTAPVPEVDVTVAALRDDIRVRAGGVSSLVPIRDVTGSEVVAAYLAGVPECMIDWDPRALSSHGRVVTFLVPAAYSNTVPGTHVMNRGVAVAALCSAIISAAHSVEVRVRVRGFLARSRGPARPLLHRRPGDLGRRAARRRAAPVHDGASGELRRLWFGVWDSAEAGIAART